MKTLKDFPLERGDWVKFSYDKKWRELAEMDGIYYLFDHVTYSPSYEVEAVLRPSVIIRDRLEEILQRAYSREKGDCVTFPQSFYFKEIHPKEEKKSLFDEIFQGRYRTDFSEDLKKFIKPICDEIDKLKNKENEG